MGSIGGPAKDAVVAVNSHDVGVGRPVNDSGPLVAYGALADFTINMNCRLTCAILGGCHFSCSVCNQPFWLSG